MVIIFLELLLTMMHGESMVVFGLFILVAVVSLSNLRHLKIVEGIQFDTFLPVI